MQERGAGKVGRPGHRPTDRNRPGRHPIANHRSDRRRRQGNTQNTLENLDPTHPATSVAASQQLPQSQVVLRVCLTAASAHRTLYLTLRPWKKPLLVVFCLIFAVSPCSAVLISACVVAASFETSDLSPGPFGLRLAGGTGGI